MDSSAGLTYLLAHLLTRPLARSLTRSPTLPPTPLNHQSTHQSTQSPVRPPTHQIWPPLFRVLRHERLLISFGDTASERRRFVQMSDLPAFLACYHLAHDHLLANLRVAWPAFVWGNGTAYEHVLLEMASVVGKRASNALRRVLAVHGARYVAEVTQVPLDDYSEQQVP